MNRTPTILMIAKLLRAMNKRETNKSLDTLEENIQRAVDKIMELKKRENQREQRKAEVVKRLQGLVKKIEDFSGKGKG